MVPVATKASILKMKYTIYLKNLLNVDVVTSTFTMQFSTTVEWIDERLT